MPIYNSKLAIRIAITLVLSMIGSLALFGSRYSAASISTQPVKQPRALKAVGEANPYIKLQQSRDLQPNYAGAGAATISSAMLGSKMRPLAMASADLNDDGYPDLVCGYGSAGGGMLTLYRGDPQAFAPTDPEVIKGIARSEFPEPFLEEATVQELAEAPDFVGTGDFNRDGKIDLVVAARGGSTLYLLEGDGAGRFANPLSIPLPGAVSAMVTGGINNRDGLVDVILGIDSPSGSSLLVYDGIKSILETTGIEYSLPAKATSLALGRLDDDGYEDLAILANGQVLILHGRDNSNDNDARASKKAGKLETVETPFTVKAFALGEFIWDRDSRVEMAMMADDGSVHIIARGELDTRPWTQEEMLEKRREMARIRDRAERRRGRSGPAMVTEAAPPAEALDWQMAEDIPAPPNASISAAAVGSGDGPVTPLMFSTRISTLPSDDLLIVNPATRQLQLRYKETPKEGDVQLASKSAERSSVSVDLDSDVTAVLPMRVNVDSRPGFVTMSKGKGAPSVFIPMAGSTFTVTTATDSAAAGSGSLRRAIIDANATPGADMIVFNAGINPTLTITSGGAHEDAAASGDLDINDSVTITGNSQTVISTSYTNTCGDCKVFGVNQTGAFTGIAVSFSGVTIQNGFNDGTNFSGSFFETGGGIDFFITGTGNNHSMTNCVITNNKTQNGIRSHGGGVNVDGHQTGMIGGPSGGSITFTNCTVTNNSATADGGGGMFLAADIHNVNLTNCTVTGNSCTGAFSTGGGVQINHSFGGTLTIGGGGSVSNNTVSVNGGGFAIVGNQVTNINGITIGTNTATGTGGSSLGGGVLIDSLGASAVTGSTTLTNVTISTNHANNGAAAAGGGVWAGGFYAVTMSGCTVSGNTSKDGAGVVNAGNKATPAETLAISGGSFTGNAATGTGGAFVSTGTGTASVTTFSNVMIGGTGAGQPNTAVNGGGIADTQTGSVTVTGNSISGNTATTSGGGVFISGGSLTLDGVTVDSNTATNGDGLHQSGGTFTGANTLNFNGGDSINLVGGTFNSTPGTLNLTGNFTNSGGNFVHNSGTVVFNGTTAQSLGGSTSSTFNILTVNKTGTLTLGVNTSIASAPVGNLSVNAGTFDLSNFTINRAAAGGTLTVSNGATLKIGGTNTLPSNFNTHSIGATSTIEYSGSSQNVAPLNSSQKYGNLLTSGSGTKTLTGAISIATLLSIGSSTTLDVSGSSFGISFTGANWTNNGTFTPRSGTVTFDPTSGTQLLSGNTTFFNLTLQNTGATTDLGSGTTTINNTLSKTNGSMSGGTGTIVFTGVAGSIIGAGAKEFNNLTINSGATITHSAGSVDIKNDYANSGTFTQGSALTTTFITGSDGLHSLSGGGTTTFGNVTINSSNTVDAGSHSFNVVGASFTVTGTFTGNTSTVTFNGAVAQTILGNGTKNFSGLTINNANGVTVNDTTPAVDASVSGALTLTTNLTIAAGAVVQQSGTSAGAGDAIGTIRRTDLGVTARAFGNLNNTIAVDTGTAPTQMDVTLALIAPPDFTTSVTRTYTLTPTGGSGISATVKLHYLNAQLNSNTEAKLGLWKKVAGVWVVQGRTGAVDTVNKAVTLSGVSSFSDWTLANMADVSVTVAPASVLEDSGTALVYTFARTGATTQALLVNFSVGGTATPPGGATPDYSQTGADTFTTTTGTVTIGVGNATATVSLTPTADTVVETDETAILTVTTGTTYNVVAPSAATGTITNDDADVSVAVSPLSTSEDGATNLVYTFTRVGATAGALTVNFSIGGAATPPGGATPDYSQTGAATFTPPTGTVTFGAGNATATVTVDPTADNVVEPDETVVLTVTSGTGYNVGSPSAATGTILNDDADVSVAVSPASVIEDGAPNLVYTFTRTGFTGAALTINFTVGGTAVFIAGPGSDYTQTGAATFTPTTGTVTFTGTNTTTTVTIDPSVDATAEPDETVILTVNTGTGYSPAAPTSATGTILNDDTLVSVAASPTSVTEDGATNMVYTFTRNGDTTASLLVNFSVGGSATFNTDYTQTGADTFTASTGTITIASGSATGTVTIDPTTDTTVEPDETVILTVTAGTGYVPGAPSAATGTITNDDTDVSVAVSPTSVAEDGATNLVYTFTRTGVTTGALTVNFSVGGTATFSTDYTQTGAATFTASSGTVTLGAGNSTATVTVDPTADNTNESDESVILTVTSGTGYNVGAPSAATGTITNDDSDVSVAVSPASVLEDGATNLVYTFTRTGFTGAALTINFSVGGTATFSTDYTQTGAATFNATTGTVTFTGTNTTTTVTIDPSVDTTGEADETVILTVTNGTGYSPANPTSATGTILNDDTAVSVAVSPTSVAEDGAINMVYTFTRTGDTSASLLVNFTVGGGATFSTDYTQTGADTFTASSGTITIAIGNASASLTIDPTADMTVEPDETVILTVAAGSGYSPGPPNPATGTITNDDTDISVAVSPASVAEDGATNLVFTFTRSGVTTGALTVNFSVGGTADSSTDYTQTGAASFTPPTGTVTFGAGNSTATVTVDPTSDTTVESDETVILTVTSGTGYNVGAPSSATGTITNDDTDVSLTVSPSSVFEDGATNLVYTFSRTGVTASSLTVNFSVGGTALFASDYTQSGAATFGVSSGTVTFGAGNSTATVTVDPSGDTTPEPDETVTLMLTAGTGYSVVMPDTASATIINDDTDVSVAVSPSSVFEDGATNLVYTFTRVGITTGALTVNFTVGGTAGFGTDYGQSGADAFSTSAGMVTIGAGNSTATVTIDPSADLTVEPDETAVLTVASGTGYNPSGPAATGTILNDDTDVTLAVSPASTAEDGAGNLVYTFTRTGVTTGALTVNFSVGGTATFSTDYTQTGAATFTASAGTVTIGAGNSTATVTVDPSTDTTVESDETVILMVTSGTGYNIGMPDTATGTITNDDTDVTLTLSPSSVGEDGSTNLVYTFTRSGVTTSPLTVNFSVGGTATLTSDYTQTGAATYGASSGTVTIASGNTSATVSLTPVNDVKVEGNETAALAITSGSYGIGTPNSATGTIVDNDTATVAFAASSSNAPEQTATHNVGVTLVITANGAGTPMLERSVSVNVQDLGTGSATGGGTDYTYSPNPKTVTFASGDIAQTKNVSITIVNDSLSEGNETINFALNTLVDGTGGQVSLVSPTADTVTIVDNDIDLKVTKTESADPVAAGGGPGNLTYTVKVKNNGLTNATGVVMSEVLTVPAGTTVDSVMVNVGSVIMNTATNYTWNIGSLGVGVEGTLTAVLTVGAGTAAGTNTICDTATITGSTENRVNTGDDSAMECTSVVAQADVEITSKTDAPDPVCVGGDITYTISYKNNGPGPGLNAKVTDAVPANTTLVSASTMSAGWSRTDSVAFGGTGNIVFAKSSSPNGETATFTIVVRVNAGTLHGTTITNTATASSDLADPTGGNNSKMATTTVDPIAPTILCPANVTAVTNQAVCQTGGCQIVNYATPAAMDNCAGVQVVCVPPSGACMPTGSTTVMCTATDTAGNTASCSFSVTVFDVCLQDDSNPGTVLLFNSQTGQYRFCCGGTTFTGTGTVAVRGCTMSLTHNPGDRRMSASVDKTQFKGSATLQSPPGVTKCTIIDRDIRNNSCNCQ